MERRVGDECGGSAGTEELFLKEIYRAGVFFGSCLLTLCDDAGL